MLGEGFGRFTSTTTEGMRGKLKLETVALQVQGLFCLHVPSSGKVSAMLGRSSFSSTANLWYM